jgi:hypothetical protein
MSASGDLSQWIERVKATKDKAELFSLLDKFRVLEWTDEQRSSIAKLYMRLLDVLPDGEAPTASAHIEHSKSQSVAQGQTGSSTEVAIETVTIQEVEQEEVWYEKM